MAVSSIIPMKRRFGNMNYKNNTASLSSSFLIEVSYYFILKPSISKIHGGKTT